MLKVTSCTLKNKKLVTVGKWEVSYLLLLFKHFLSVILNAQTASCFYTTIFLIEKDTTKHFGLIGEKKPMNL